VLPESTTEVIVLSADVPLLDSDTVRAALGWHYESGADVTLLSCLVDNPTGYGRVIREADGQVARIVEDSDVTETERDVGEINAGVYVFNRRILHDQLAGLGTDNAQGEKYLTDVVAGVVSQGGSVNALLVEDSWLLEGVNDFVQLSEMQRRLNRMIVRGWQKDGVAIGDPDSVWIDLSVSLSPDVVLHPGVHLEGSTSVGRSATIGPDSSVVDTEVGEGASIVRSVLHGSVIEAGATIGPFSFVRPGTHVGAGGKVGAFVETKNARIGPAAKVPHLSYIGDADIGEGANIGAGTITANYDGVNKHRTEVGPHARTGSNNVFVAPVQIGAGAYTAAGTAIRRNVPAGALAVAPVSVRVIDGWVAQNRAGTASANAAAEATDHPREN